MCIDWLCFVKYAYREVNMYIDSLILGYSVSTFGQCMHS